jgi:hypothetical protein
MRSSSASCVASREARTGGAHGRRAREARTGGATSDESDEGRFFAPDELPATTFPEQVHRLRDALLAQPEALLQVAQRPSSREVAQDRASPEAD